MGNKTRKSIYSKEQKDLVARLKWARSYAKLTQVQVAKKLGRPQSWVSRLEAGQRRVDIVEVQLLAKLYGVPLTKLLSA